MKPWTFISRLALVLTCVAAINLAGVAAAPSDEKADSHGKAGAATAHNDHDHDGHGAATSGGSSSTHHADEHASSAKDDHAASAAKPAAAATAGPSSKPALPEFQSYARKAVQPPAAATAHDPGQPTVAGDHHDPHTTLNDAKIGSHGAPAATSTAAEPDQIITSSTEALKLLMEGNERWMSGTSTNPHVAVTRRKMLAEQGQHPYATILTCSDSRLPAERLFDCGVGDIFVIRVAGNVMGVSEAGTIEYGVEHLHTPLLVVMGHTKCGAVSAAVTHAHVAGSIESLIDHIEPAVTRAQRLHPEHSDAELIPDAIRENVWQSVFDLLKSSEICRGLVNEGKLQIVGAVCDISTGEIEWLGEHPWQAELVDAMSSESKTQPEMQTVGHAAEH